MKARPIKKRENIKKYRNTINGFTYVIKDNAVFMAGNILTSSAFSVQAMKSCIERGIFLPL